MTSVYKVPTPETHSSRLQVHYYHGLRFFKPCAIHDWVRLNDCTEGDVIAFNYGTPTDGAALR
jgi:hypothetical protein